MFSDHSSLEKPLIPKKKNLLGYDRDGEPGGSNRYSYSPGHTTRHWLKKGGTKTNVRTVGA